MAIETPNRTAGAGIDHPVRAAAYRQDAEAKTGADRRARSGRSEDDVKAGGDSNNDSNGGNGGNGGSGVGAALPRIDARLKVTGMAHYTSDHRFPDMLTAVPVCATIARGTVAAIDTSAAAAMPGVRKIYTHENMGRLYRPAGSKDAQIDEKRPPMEDDRVLYYGQYVAMVVADTFEQAEAAAALVKVEYRKQAFNIDKSMTFEEIEDGEPEVVSERGDAARAFDAAGVSVDETYTTPVETHNPIELHASVALYDGENFTLYETSQAIVNHKAVMVQMLGVQPENVRVVTRYLGSGFGGKLWPWGHSLLAAMAARDLGVPIKLVVSRGMMFHNVGHRTNTRQRVRMSADKDGKLTSLRQDFLYHMGRDGGTEESCGEATGYLYGVDNLRVTGGNVLRDIAPNTSMRGPGAVPGLFCTESAYDELAVKLGIDPVQLRLQNEPEKDQDVDLPFSSRHLSQCLSAGAERFGWNERDARVGSMRRDGEIVGWGVASCSWMAKRVAAEATLMLMADGRVRVSSAVQDIGTGTYTMLAQMVNELTGIAPSDIEVSIGDTSLPPGPFSGGSMATASMVPAVAQATRKAIEQLITVATETEDSPFNEAESDDLTFSGGRLHRKDQPAREGLAFAELLRLAKLAQVDGKGKGSASTEEGKKQSIHSYGAHFVEVRWQPEIARLRVSRVLSVIDAGRIINPRTGRNQIEGAVVMGIGMALFEETHYDTRNGKPVNNNMADYVMATNADSPEIDVLFVEHPDLALDEIGARGIGEIGIAGLAAAVTSAVYHATGVRVRDLPVKIEDLLASKVV